MAEQLGEQAGTMDAAALTALVGLHGELILAQGRLMSALERRDLAAICQAKRCCALLTQQVQLAQQATAPSQPAIRGLSASGSG